MIREIEQLLRSVKDAPEFGGDYSVEKGDEIWQRIAARIGVEETQEPFVISGRDYLQYLSWQLSHVWMRPVSVALSVFALIFGGWIATVNASFDSVPGDVLYPVKLATERMQITLATSGQQRAKLHAEFAGRRLDELTTITTSDVDGKEIRVKAAVNGFKQEIASVNSELADIQTSDPKEAAALAIIVDQKTDEYETTIAQSGTGASADSKEDIAEALDAAELSNTQAINTIVQSHETNQQPQTEESIQKNFQNELNDLNTRVTLSLGRLAVIEEVLAKNGMTQVAFTVRIMDARSLAETHTKSIEEAMDVFAAGGYRTAFDLLVAVETQIKQSEDIITELEIEITTTPTSSGSATGL